MKGWFDLAIADELHQLAGETAQGNAPGVLARAGRRLLALTGTLMGGYADDLFNVFYRMEPHMMVAEVFPWGGGEGRRSFQEQYGVLQTIETVPEEDISNLQHRTCLLFAVLSKVLRSAESKAATPGV